MQLYFNPECSKCREAYHLIESRGESAEIIDYLNEPPTPETLRSIIRLLGIAPIDLVRKKEPLFTEHYENQSFSDEEWLLILSQNPILIERPIFIHKGKAIIGRPPEKVLELL